MRRALLLVLILSLFACESPDTGQLRPAHLSSELYNLEKQRVSNTELVADTIIEIQSWDLPNSPFTQGDSMSISWAELEDNRSTLFWEEKHIRIESQERSGKQIRAQAFLALSQEDEELNAKIIQELLHGLRFVHDTQKEKLRLLKNSNAQNIFPEPGYWLSEWHLHISGRVLKQNDKVLSYLLHYQLYDADVHIEDEISIFTMALKKGQLLSFHEIVQNPRDFLNFVYSYAQLDMFEPRYSLDKLEYSFAFSPRSLDIYLPRRNFRKLSSEALILHIDLARLRPYLLFKD